MDNNDINKVMSRSLENIAKNIFDEYIKANVEQRRRVGMSPVIIRQMHNETCDWCRSLAGVYEYGTEPAEVYQRHDNCDCTVIYRSNKNTYQDVWGREEYNSYEEASERQKRYVNLIDQDERRQAKKKGDRDRAKRVDEIIKNSKTRDEIISLNETLSQHKDGDKVFITEQAINKVKKVNPSGYSNENIKLIEQKHIELLKYAREENYSNEVACLVNIKNNKSLNFVKGSVDEINIEGDTDYFHWLRTCEPGSLALLHNHPGLSYFSLNDINMFMKYDSIKTMTIVTNQGKVWYINKNENFNIQKAIETMSDLKDNEKDKDVLVEKFFKKGYYYGVDRN